MSLRKRVAKLELDVYMAELDTKATEKRLERLECEHTLKRYEYCMHGGLYFVVCQKCGKTLKRVTTEEYLSIEEARIVSELVVVNDAIKANAATKKK